MSEEKLHNIIHAMRYNYPLQVSTFGNCAIKSCNNSARGSGKCGDCCEKELAELTGKPMAANEFHLNTKRNARILSAMIEEI